MKRFMLAAIALCISASAPQQWNNVGVWYVKNTTKQALNIIWPRSWNEEWKTGVTIAVGDSLKICQSIFSKPKGKSHYEATTPTFDGLYNDATKYNHDVVEVSSETDKTLKVWRYSDVGQPGRQLFDEALWHRYDNQPRTIWVADNLSTTVWVFDILSEDITN